MYERTTTWPCPLGIVTAVKQRWRAGGTDKPFYGWSHMTPTPRGYFLQQLGLVITKANAVHLRNARMKFGPYPRGRRKGRPTGRGHRANGAPADDDATASGGCSRSPGAAPP